MRRLFLCLLPIACLLTSAVNAMTLHEREEVATLLALLLDSGRVVLAQHQDLINNPDVDAKGFTPEVFEREVVREFHTRSRLVDLTALDEMQMSDEGKYLLRTLLLSGKTVIAEQQGVINRKGTGFKNVIPATWGTLTARKFSEATGIHLKQTTIHPRNPANAPDPFERKVLAELANPRYPRDGDLVSSDVTDDGRLLRVLYPLYYKQECLMCHGTPKGQIDISGYPKEGHRLADLAGAISVALPTKTQRP